MKLSANYGINNNKKTINMKKLSISLFMLLVMTVGTQAKSWKIGPSSVNGMDFDDINAAVASDKVGTGDTLYLDQYFSTSDKQIVTKKLVIIGTGYDTSFTDEQVVATLNGNLQLKVDGIQVKSCRLTDVYFYADECVIDRCYTQSIQIGAVPNGKNYIYSCYITGVVGNQVESSSSISYDGTTTKTYVKAQFDIQNCVFYRTSNCIQYLTNSIVNNNTFRMVTSSSSNYCLNNLDNSQITNNIIYGAYNSGSSNYCLASGIYAVGSGNTIEHNIMSQSVPSNYPNNKMGSNILSLFTQTGNYSDYYKLKTNVTDNFALTYGTDGKEVGCHGGMFGCPSGGRALYIPYFTKVVVGQRSENGKLPVSLEVKIQDK